MANAAKYYGTGRRKKSIARVYLVPGKGDITINKRPIDEYFGLETLKVIVRQPMAATDTDGKFDVLVNVKGGGIPDRQALSDMVSQELFWKQILSSDLPLRKLDI